MSEIFETFIETLVGSNYICTRQLSFASLAKCLLHIYKLHISINFKGHALFSAKGFLSYIRRKFAKPHPIKFPDISVLALLRRRKRISIP